jgi:hypothetical protein
VSIEEREGVLDHVSEKGILLSGARLSYSKWFEGDRPTEDALGCRIRVVVDAGEKCTFLKKIVRIGEKANGWKPPEPSNSGFSGGGGGRRFSPEELDLKRDEGIRIARSVAIDRAIMMAKEGISIDKVVPLALVIEEYVLKGKLPAVTTASGKEAPGKGALEKPPSASLAQLSPGVHPESSRPPAPVQEATPTVPAKPKRLAARVVSGLFNEAMRGGLVSDWRGFLTLLRNVLGVEVKDPYHLGVAEFARVESVVRAKLGKSSAA